MTRQCTIRWEPESGKLEFASDMSRLELTAIFEMAKQANLREMMGGGGRPNENGATITGAVRSPALQPRKIDR